MRPGRQQCKRLERRMSNLNFNVMKALAIRNNNPLNIRFSPLNVWKGQTGSNKGFVTFENMEYGYRAALVLLRSYVKRGYDTVTSIISRWAPESENNTSAYIRTVVAHFNGYTDTDYHNLTADTKLPKDDPDALFSYLIELAWIMSLVETGYLSKVQRDFIKGYTVDRWPSDVSSLYDALMEASRKYF